MEEYVLYLDESCVNKKGKKGRKEYFCLAGAIFKKNQIPEIEKRVIEIKKDIWLDTDYSYFNFNNCSICEENNEYNFKKCKVRNKWCDFDIDNLKIEDIILHDTEIRSALKSGHRSCLYEPYNQIFREYRRARQYYNQIKNIYEDESLDINIIGLTVDKSKVQDIYNYDFSIHHKLYAELFRGIIKKYMMFLLENNGVGSIVIESSNDDSSKKHGITIDDCTMDMYYNVKANGIGLMTSKLVQQRLKDYSILDKRDNNQCLQLVDSIPNHIARTAAKLKPENYLNRNNLKHRYWNEDKREETFKGVVSIY